MEDCRDLALIASDILTDLDLSDSTRKNALYAEAGVDNATDYIRGILDNLIDGILSNTDEPVLEIELITE